MSEQEQHFPISLIFFRFLTGFGAGLTGTVIWGLILLFSWSIVGDILSPAEGQHTEMTGIGLQVQKENTHSLFLYIVIFAVFMATTVANLTYLFISSALEEKYSARFTGVTHVFFAALLFVFLLLPGYLVGNSLWGPVGIAVAALLHILLTGIFTFFTQEIITETKHLLVNLYGALLALAMFFFVGYILAKTTPAVASFLALPFLLGMFGAGNGIAEGVYHWFYQTYGNDVLHAERRFGADYAEEEVEDDNTDI